MKVIELNVYKYEELSEAAKDKARAWYSNDDGLMAQWEIETDLPQFLEEKWGNGPKHLSQYPNNVPSLPDIGLYANFKDCQYELGSYSGRDHITPKRIDIVNPRLFLQWLGVDLRTWPAQWLINGCIEFFIKGITGYWGSSKMSVEFDIMEYPESMSDNDYNSRYDKLVDIAAMIEDKINDLLYRYARSLLKSIEYRYTRESIEESIIINEYDFLENGEVYP